MRSGSLVHEQEAHVHEKNSHDYSCVEEEHFVYKSRSLVQAERTCNHRYSSAAVVTKYSSSSSASSGSVWGH